MQVWPVNRALTWLSATQIHPLLAGYTSVVPSGGNRQCSSTVLMMLERELPEATAGGWSMFVYWSKAPCVLSAFAHVSHCLAFTDTATSVHIPLYLFIGLYLLGPLLYESPIMPQWPAACSS